MFNLFSSEKPIAPTVCFNTDSIWDYITGDLRQGVDGKFYVNGGLSPAVIGVMARSNMYKSTFTASLLARCAALYKQQIAIFDSEDSISRGTERILRMAGNHQDELSDGQVMTFDATTEYDLALIEKKLKEIGAKKMEHRKELTFTAPFVDPATGEAQKIWAPTFIFLDSLTEMHGGEEDEMIDGKQGLNDSKVKTVYMKDANAKTIFLRKIRRMAVEYGFVIASTAHYGKQLNLDSYGPTPKQLQWMQQDYAPKGVGSKFLFLTSPQFFVVGCKCLQDDAKECWYKLNGHTPPTDINEIVGQIQRCKNAPSGNSHPYIVSQESGLLTDVTDYNYLKSMKNFGLTGNNVTCQNVFTPMVNLTRNTVRGICADREDVVRGLQITAQLCYLQKYWNDETLKNTFGFSAHVDPAKLMDWMSSDKCEYRFDRVLKSRGYWLPKELEADADQEYISIFDILSAYAKANKT